VALSLSGVRIIQKYVRRARPVISQRPSVRYNVLLSREARAGNARLGVRLVNGAYFAERDGAIYRGARLRER